jgi:hypothetical protein
MLHLTISLLEASTNLLDREMTGVVQNRQRETGGV